MIRHVSVGTNDLASSQRLCGGLLPTIRLVAVTFS